MKPSHECHQALRTTKNNNNLKIEKINNVITLLT